MTAGAVLTSAAFIVLDGLIAGFFTYVETENFLLSIYAFLGACAISLLECLAPGLSFWTGLFGAIETYGTCIDDGMEWGSALFFALLDLLLSMLPGRTLDEGIDILVEILLKDGKITKELFVSMAAITKEKEREKNAIDCEPPPPTDSNVDGNARSGGTRWNRVVYIHGGR